VTAKDPTEARRLTWVPPTLLVVLVGGVGLVGLLHVRAANRGIVRQQREALVAVANAKAQALAAWCGERRGDARVIQQSAPLVAWLVQAASAPRTTPPEPAVVAWMGMLAKAYGYRSIALLDKAGVAAASWPAAMDLEGFEPALVARAAAGREPLFSDLEPLSPKGPAILDLAVPLRVMSDRQAPASAVLLLRISPSSVLLPMMRAWPALSPSGVSLYVRRGDARVLLITPRREGAVEALATLSQAPAGSPAALAASGDEEFAAGAEREGVPVLTVVRSIPGTSWSIVARVDRGALEGPLRRSVIKTAGVDGLLLVAGIALIGMVWRKQREDARRRERAAAAENAALVEHFSTLADRVNDIIVLADAEGRIVQVNDRAVHAYGYTREELQQLTLRELRAPSERATLEADLAAVRTEGGGVYQTVSRRKDGSTFPIEVSVRRLEIGGVEYTQGIVRDISERVETETKLRQAGERLRLLVEGTPHFFFYLQDLDGTTTYVSPSVEAITGRSVNEWLGQRHWFVTDNAINELARQRTREHEHGVFTSEPTLVEIEHADGHRVLLEAVETGRYEKGRLVGLQGIAHDVTEQRRSAAAERKRASQLALVNRIARHVAALLDQDELLRVAVDEIRESFGFRNVTLLNVDRKRGLLHRQVIAGAYAELASPAYRQEIGAGLIGLAARGGEPILSNDTEADPRYIRGFGPGADTRSELAVPIKIGAEVVGVLDIQENRTGAFDETDVQTITTLADQIASSLNNAKLFGALQRELAERELAEVALQDALAWQEQIFEGSRDAVFISDPDSRFTAVSRAASRLTGFSRSELLSMGIPDLHDEIDLRAYESYHDRIMAGEEIVSEARLRRKDGSKIDVEFSNVAFGIGGRRFMHTTARDVSERKRAETALRESENRYRRFFEEDLTGDFVSTPDGRLLDCNPAFAKILGFASPAEAKKVSLWELHPSREARERYLSLLRERGTLTYQELELRNASGKPVQTIANVIATLDEQGAITEIRGYLFDITQHKLVEEQLRHSQKMEALGRVAGGVAHDFNNLLQAMLTTLQLLRLRPADAATTAAELEGMVRRGASLARQLLLFARRGVTKPERIDLGAFAVESSRFLARLLPDNVRLETIGAPGALPVDADRGQLEQVLTNLVLNAVDALPTGGTVTLRTGALADREVWFEVEDHGVGIPRADLERIFDPFFTTKPPGKGTGLGLAVVHGIVSQHGGRLKVESDVGRGSIFRVALPRGGPEPGGPSPAVAADAVAGRRERVLVVEDNASVRELLIRLLGRLGYTTVEMPDAEEAAALGEEQRCDVLLSDVSLPGASGADLARRLTRRWPELKVILMSGYAEDEALRQDITAGRFRFLQKPIDLDTLAKELRAALHESG
jgi:two-component system, cell cycle sensor histidine kinase and response regulator CckA